MARKKTTLPEFQANLKKLAKDVGKAVRTPMREEQKRIRDYLISEYWKHHLGAKIWRWRSEKWNLKGGPTVKLGEGKRPKYPRWSNSGQAWVAPITITRNRTEKSLAAKIEEGGRLNHHVSGGDRRSAGRGLGTQVKPRPVFYRLTEREFYRRTVPKIAESFGKFVEKTL